MVRLNSDAALGDILSKRVRRGSGVAVQVPGARGRRSVLDGVDWAGFLDACLAT